MEKKHCITCGKEMENKGAHRVSKKKWATRTYCSFECRKVESQRDFSKSKTCPTCETTFYKKENERGYTWRDKVYCSSKCANARKERTRKKLEKTCPICNGIFYTRFDKVVCCSVKCNGIMHGRNQSGEGHNRWNGGRVITKQGYVRIWIPDDSPFVSMRPKGSSHVLEHRLVMAKKLGRVLLDHEQVHHKNAIRDDNDPENLELRTGSHGNGATVHCPTCTCNVKKVETEYLPDFNFN